MDEALEAAEVVADSEFEGVVVWLFRIVGVLMILAGLGLWLTGTMSLLWVPAGLIVVGLGLVVAPQVLLLLAELT